FNNPESQIRINKIINSHNHLLSIEQINFEENKKFSPEMLEDIKFLTSHCKFRATVQRKFLEGNTNSYIEVLYRNKTYWAHCFIQFKFTGGMISTSRIESVNSCLKRLLHSSNISLCELMDEVHRLLDMQDQKEEYNFWKLAIPCIRSQNKTNFLFKKINGCLERILTPIMLQKHRDKINQSVYYEANEFMTDDIERHCHNEQENETYDTSLVEMQQILLNELIYLVGGMDNITNIWSVKVESFMNADKFYEEKSIEETGSPTAYLCAFNQDNRNFLEESLSLLQQRKVYGELYSIYKKALNKVLKSQTKSQQLIDLLQEFTEKIELSENSSEDSSEVLSEDSSEDEVDSDKENQKFILLNPKKRRRKGRPAGNKRLKSACEPKKGTKKQERHCKKCGKEQEHVIIVLRNKLELFKYIEISNVMIECSSMSSLKFSELHENLIIVKNYKVQNNKIILDNNSEPSNIQNDKMIFNNNSKASNAKLKMLIGEFSIEATR
ncbi:25909_t:CDS:2, partial [Gigaspora margarita]